MRAIERDNDTLKGVLPKIFGKADFSAQMLGGLIDHFTNLNLTGAPEDCKPITNRVWRRGARSAMMAG
jgi:type I restriction enzyme M protein